MKEAGKREEEGGKGETRGERRRKGREGERKRGREGETDRQTDRQRI